MTSDKVTAALDQLTAGLDELISSDRWADYLTTQAKFHRYSPNNVLLIMLQNPDASQVAGYRAWQGMGRQVRKGEHALKILAPCTVKKDKDNPDAGRKLVGFRVASVFDIDQTEGDELPEVAHVLTGADPTGALATIVDQITGRGFTYRAEPVQGGANGYTIHAEHLVVVDSTLPPAQQVKTAAHELAHVIMHAPDDPNRPASRELVEVEAESVAFVTLHALGFDTGDYSLGYVAGWSGGDVDKVRKVADRVTKTARALVDAITPAEQGQVAA